MSRFISLAALALALSAGATVHAGTPVDPALQAASDDTEPVDRFIVRFREAGAEPRSRLVAIGGTFGERLEHVRAMSGGAHVVRLGRRILRREARELARRLGGDPAVLSLEPDLILRAMVAPNDPMYAQQWALHEPRGGINVQPAWDRTTGAGGITVAVLDTGVVRHAELAARLVGGHDFVTSTSMSNDGDGRDTDASDPGDHGCDGASSTWHGTHVAGTIGAAGNDGTGIAGVNWGSRLLPVRVLGRCGGYTSDIVDGLRWAAGMSVPGVPANAFPARVANLSLGGDGACSSAFQNAVNDVVARGMVVVVAAGNENKDAVASHPASCNGVIAVAATTRAGGRAAYSNFGARVAIAAPGGGGNDGILSTLNTGSTTPVADRYAWFQGTSMATPHVSGVVSLMLSLDPSLTPAQVAQRLQASARPFPTGTGSDCQVGVCGAGIVDAAASLAGLGGTAPAPSPSPSPAPVPAPAPAPAPGWTRIADEGQGFTVSGTQTVRYGTGANWITRQVTGAGTCSNAFFGNDPAAGTRKQCELSAAAPPASDWTTLASEGQTFSVAGTQTVRYGSGSQWVTRTVSGGGLCTNAFFGADPIVGTVKLCQVSTAAGTAPAPGWARIATEGDNFAVSGTQTVRYGSGMQWLTRSVAHGGSCSNAWFGSDPAPGVYKQCEVSVTGAARVR